MKVDPDACSGDQTVTLDHRRYYRETMFTVNKELSHVFHAKDVFIISVGGVHITHTVYQRPLDVKGTLFSVMCPYSEHGHKMTWDSGGGKVETRGRSSGVCGASNFGVVVA